MVVEVFFKVNLSLMEQLIAIRQVRRACTLPQVLFASRTLYADVDAKIVECNSSAAAQDLAALLASPLSLRNQGPDHNGRGREQLATDGGQAVGGGLTVGSD